MWLCLNDGFLSVVEDFHNPQNLLVRARDATSIPNIFGAEYSVEVTPNNDYRYRASIPRGVVAKVVATRLVDINYGNFKNSVGDDDLHDAYSKFWEVMYKYQNGV